MAKSDNQKLKILYIARILWEESDEQHPVTTQKLIEILDSDYGIKAERKSIYSDIEYLKDFGFDIELSKTRSNPGYFLASKTFEVAEIKLLVDMIQSSRFLTQKKSRELIDKIESLASRHEAGMLNRNVYVQGRARTENENVYYNIDYIHTAINDNRTISFQYCTYSADKELKLKRGGGIYTVSPYYLTWSNENYYLIAVDNAAGRIKHYRVDRMKKIRINEEARKYKELFADFNIAEYSGATFGMFGGEKKKLNIRFTKDLIDVVIDRFGKNISIHKAGEDYFTVSLSVVPSGQFYGWLAGLGTRAVIISPQEEKEAFHDYIGRIYLNYDLN